MLGKCFVNGYLLFIGALILGLVTKKEASWSSRPKLSKPLCGMCLLSIHFNVRPPKSLSCLLPIWTEVSPWSLSPSPTSSTPPIRSCLPPNCHASNFLSRLKGHQDGIKLPVHAKPKWLWSRAQRRMLNWILSNQHQLRASR